MIRCHGEPVCCGFVRSNSTAESQGGRRRRGREVEEGGGGGGGRKREGKVHEEGVWVSVAKFIFVSCT